MSCSRLKGCWGPLLDQVGGICGYMYSHQPTWATECAPILVHVNQSMSHQRPIRPVSIGLQDGRHHQRLQARFLIGRQPLKRSVHTAWQAERGPNTAALAAVLDRRRSLRRGVPAPRADGVANQFAHGGVEVQCAPFEGSAAAIRSACRSGPRRPTGARRSHHGATRTTPTPRRAQSGHRRLRPVAHSPLARCSRQAGGTMSHGRCAGRRCKARCPDAGHRQAPAPRWR
jgi:hypothetical protein